MNKRKLQNSAGTIVEIYPPVIHKVDNGNAVSVQNDHWRITSYDADRERLALSRIGGGEYCFLLFLDQIIEYQNAGLLPPSIKAKQGRLILKCQITVTGDGLVTAEPIGPKLTTH